MTRPVLSLVFLRPHEDIPAPDGAEYAIDRTGQYFVERTPDEHRPWIFHYRRVLIEAVPHDAMWLDVTGWEACDQQGQPLAEVAS